MDVGFVLDGMLNVVEDVFRRTILNRCHHVFGGSEVGFSGRELNRLGGSSITGMFLRVETQQDFTIGTAKLLNSIGVAIGGP